MVSEEEKIKRLQDKTKIISDKILEIFSEEFKKNREDSYLTIFALIGSPITFLMNAFELVVEKGVEPNTIFPDFVSVYLNYINSFIETKDMWDKKPFKEFQKAFVKAYKKHGHIVTEISDINEN